MAEGFHLLITLKSSDGGKGVQKYTGPDSAPMEWDRPADGDGETTEVLIQLIDCHGVETDSHDMDGDDWRHFEEVGGPAKVLRWLNNPKFFGGLTSCVLAVNMECDPDGWTDAHEEIERLQGLHVRTEDTARTLTDAAEHLRRAAADLQTALGNAPPVATVLLLTLVPEAAGLRARVKQLAGALREEARHG